VDAEGVVLDHVGGLDDIAPGASVSSAIPFSASPKDYLRILRFFRMHASYGKGEPIVRISRLHRRPRGTGEPLAERVRMEILKLVVADGAEASIAAMADGGLLLTIVGGVSYNGPLAAMIGAERELGLEASAARRLGSLTVAVTEDAKRVASRLRLTNAEAKALDSMGHRWWRFVGIDEARAKRLLYRLGEQPYRDRLLLAWARAGHDSDSDRWRELARLPQRWSAPKFPLKAADFIARGIAEGPALGHVLTLAEDAWLAADFPLDPSALSAIADQTVARFTRDPPAVNLLSRLRRHLAGQLVLVAAWRCSLRDRRSCRLWHRRADAAGAGAADRRRAGGADHRDLGDLHQYQPLRGLFQLRRPAPRADRDRGAALTTALGAYGYTRLTRPARRW
jgi:poly(A) polymerase